MPHPSVPAPRHSAAAALAFLVPLVALAGAPPCAAQARDSLAPAGAARRPAASDTARPRAIEYSDWYARRLTAHRIGSYAVLPLFAAQYALGDRLIDQSEVPAGWVRPTHRTVAYGIAALFVANTVTGAWNLWDSRRDPAGRTRRIVHASLMLAANAGFAYTGTLAGDAKQSIDGRRRHRTAALTSIGISTVGTAMMWLWND